MLRSLAVLTILGSAVLASAGNASAFDGAGSDATKAAKVYMPTGRPVSQANDGRTQYRSFSYAPSNTAARRNFTVPTQFRADRKIRSGNTN
jgi:hypothetical protein